MPERPLPGPFAALIATLTGFLAVGVIETALVTSDGRAGDAGFGGLAPYVVGFDALVGLVVAAALALVLPSAVRIVRPGRWAREALLGRGDRSGAALNAHAAWWCAALVALAPVAVAAAIGGHAAHGFNQRSLAGPFTALAALAGVLAGAILALPVRAAVGWVLDRFAPQGRVAGLGTPALPALVVLLGVIAVAVKVAGLDLGAYKLGGYAGLVGGVVIGLALLPLMRGRSALRGALGSLALLVAVGAGVYAYQGFAEAPVARRIIPLDGHLSRVTVTTLRRLLDRDGDGYSAALAGGDCDDTNPAISPRAKEIPGNGVDDNCQGGDAPVEDVAAPPKAPEPPPEPDAPRYEPKKYNVFFLLIDTLRPDHLGLYGYARDTSPNLDAWSKSAVVFDQAYAQAPNTPRSMPSILTGRYPSRIAWTKRFSNYSDLAPEEKTAFEVFQGAGWRTEAVTSHWYFENKAPSLKEGVDAWDNAGFLTIKESNTQSAAPDLTPRVVARLDALKDSEQPFFLFAHYFDPHSRYMQQTSVRTYGKSLMDKYDSEIAFTDHHLKAVLDKLDEPGLREDTIVVILSDHGEAFKEHGFYFHGRTVYNEEIKVPLMVRVPDVEPKRIDDVVGLIDVLPTLAALTGVEAPRALGRSLLPWFSGIGEVPPAPVFLEQLPYPNYEEHVVGVVGPDRVKVIKNVTKNVIEVFDLKADPGETTNLLDRDEDAAKGLRETLLRFIDADPGE
ncbi:MAG: sulfatase-like hydrolase/transferase [Myxococcales bacterium]|nr:sulfatase-like hydrolase/transferase [Myxococcales bacterium]